MQELITENNAEFWAEKINNEYTKTVESVFQIGRDLESAFDSLDFGEWGKLTGRSTECMGMLPFSARTAERYRAIAKDKRLANATRVSQLPHSWGTLYELTTLTDDEFHSIENNISPDLTRKDISEYKATKNKKTNIANQFSAETNEWYTPDCIIEDVFQTMGDIDLDPCSDPDGNIAAKTLYMKKDDGLNLGWFGRVFMNPPYSGEAIDWANKLISEEEVSESITLVASNTDAKFFHSLLNWCTCVCFVKGRLEFKPGDGQSAGRSTVRNVIFYKGINKSLFLNNFEKYGSTICLK